MSERDVLGIRMSDGQLAALDDACRPGETRSGCARRLLSLALGVEDDTPRPGRPKGRRGAAVYEPVAGWQ